MPSQYKKQAVLLNFTANTYHWGCYGTAMELWESLVELGYYVEMVNVREIHMLDPTPQKLEDFDDPDFGTEFLKANLRIYHLLLSADVVVVNGEGTLHGHGKAAVNLLYLMYLAKVNFKKTVHLVNGSFFPSDDGAPHDVLDILYGRVAQVLDLVVPRETDSQAVLARLGVATVQGFDCLPRFVQRHGALNSHKFHPTLVVAGGVNITREQAQKFGELLAPFQSAGRRLKFLTGAKAFVNQEDARIYEEMKRHCPALECVNALSMEDWLSTLQNSACLVSARFHHTLAAASLGLPCVVFPSNTSKTNSSIAMLGLNTMLSLDQDAESVQYLLNEALAQRLEPANATKVQQVVDLAANNFLRLKI
jgi:polysaccharide pyruvyl transferase WcaK-like protein